MYRSTSVVCLVFVWAFGCDDPRINDASTGTCGDGPGVVVVGVGGSRLRPLPSSGGTLPIVLGAQGGIHVLVGFTTRDMALDMRATYTLTSSLTGETLGTPTELTLRPTLFSDQMGETVRNPDLIVLDNEAPSVDRFAGQAATLSLEAVSADSHACDSRDVTLIPPEG